MFCPHCGTQLNEGTAICPNCHEPIEAPAIPESGQNAWHQDFDNTGNWEQQGIAEGGGFGGSDYDEGFGGSGRSEGFGGDFGGSGRGEGFGGDFGGNGRDEGFGGDFGGSGRGEGFGGDFGGSENNGNSGEGFEGNGNNGSFDGNFGDNKSRVNLGGNTDGGGKKPPLKVLGIIAGVLCLIVGIVMLIMTGILPVGDWINGNKEHSKEHMESEASDPADSTAEEVRPNVVTSSHKHDLSNISVSVTGIQPPAIVENSVVKVPIGKASADSESGQNTADLMIDGDQKTFWSAGTDSKNPEIILDSGIEKEISVLEVCPGAWSSESDFEKYGIPKAIELEIDGYVYPVSFSDQMEEQYILFSESVRAEEITVRILKSTEGECAISEITMFD